MLLCRQSFQLLVHGLFELGGLGLSYGVYGGEFAIKDERRVVDGTEHF